MPWAPRSDKTFFGLHLYLAGKYCANLKVPGAQLIVNPALAIIWLVGVTIYQRWSPRGRSWPQGHILKSLASKVKSLASKPQVFENCPVLSSRTALFFVSLKSRWKTPETSWKVAKTFFVFRRSRSPEKLFCYYY